MTRELLETVPNSEPIRINAGWKLDECLENTSTRCLECCPARPTASPRKKNISGVLLPCSAEAENWQHDCVFSKYCRGPWHHRVKYSEYIQWRRLSQPGSRKQERIQLKMNQRTEKQGNSCLFTYNVCRAHQGPIKCKLKQQQKKLLLRLLSCYDVNASACLRVSIKSDERSRGCGASNVWIQSF